jgi:hypothetical protein
MSSNLIAYLIAAITVIVGVVGVFGFPALAIIAVRFFKFKERELILEMEYREKSQQQDLAIEQRVQRLEEAFSILDHDVREQLGIGQPATPLASRPELLEGPAALDTQRGQSLDPSRTKAR